MSTVFFTSDTHFGHYNIINYCNRPYGTVAQMNDSLVQNWNELVNDGDTVYHLGDFGFGSASYIRNLLDRLSGRVVLIKGNHDRGKYLNLFSEVHKTYLFDGILLAHQPDYSHPVRQLHGHCHGKGPKRPFLVDVGVDCWDYRPIPYDSIQRHCFKDFETR